MKPLYCSCGQQVYLDNTECDACGNILGFDPTRRTLTSVTASPDGRLLDAAGAQHFLCENRFRHGVCNGLVPMLDAPNYATLCSTCRLNQVVPNTERPENVFRWQRLEAAKRRMIAGLARLGLQVTATGRHPPLRFKFMEDKRSHPDVFEYFISTGHNNGVITVNVLEADEVELVQQREMAGERYRTLLGHFRHEIGHFYYPQLVTEPAEFSDLFGDPGIDYQIALDSHYAVGPPPDWGTSWISAYASSHPMEDWAECFAHYLHIQDTLETAWYQGLIADHLESATVSEELELWGELVIKMNDLNRSLGLRDPYPFIINEMVTRKLEYVALTISRLLKFAN